MTLGEFLSTSRYPIRIRLMGKDGTEICVCELHSIAAQRFADCELIDWFINADRHVMEICIHEPEGMERWKK